VPAIQGKAIMADQAETKHDAAAMQTATLRYVDRPECKEAFADSINQLYFDGQSLRIEFGITWLDDMKPNTAITGRRYPSTRLALNPSAAVDLINRMQQVAAALTQAGVLKAGQQQPKPPAMGTPASTQKN
jgi:hypothetical protein